MKKNRLIKSKNGPTTFVKPLNYSYYYYLVLIFVIKPLNSNVINANDLNKNEKA